MLTNTPIAEKLGFKDIFQSKFKGFYFDFLAKKDGKFAAFQITTLRMRSIKRKHIELATYLGFDYFLIHIKPTFDLAYVNQITSQFPKANKDVVNYHFLRGVKYALEISPSS